MTAVAIIGLGCVLLIMGAIVVLSLAAVAGKPTPSLPERPIGEEPRCPHCGSRHLFGPATICVGEAERHYYDCARCHSMVLVEADGSLTAMAGAW